MKICKSYAGIACDNCPVFQEGEDGKVIIMCDSCIYYRGCDDCLVKKYMACPEGKTDEEGGEKNE